jgi:hypothetical protein
MLSHAKIFMNGCLEFSAKYIFINRKLQKANGKGSGCEAWCLTLAGGGGTHIRGVFENRVLRRIFGPKRDEVMGERRKQHNEELHEL